jgi:hypothetical protein
VSNDEIFTRGLEVMAQTFLEKESLLVQSCELDLFAKVFDPSSLEVLWTELAAGAYGAIDRAEGLFNLVDGRGYQILYARGESDYIELEDEPCLKGRPDRPSKLQIFGHDLDVATIETTVEICTLSDLLLDHYQSQLQSQS